MLDPSPHLFWITSRAAGTSALLLSSASVTAGLAIGLGWKPRGRGADALALHEALSLATLAAIAIHGLVLLGDGFLHPDLAAIAIPFESTYRNFWVGLGIIAGYGLGLLGLTYYLRGRIGRDRWRRLHRWTALFWLLGVVHTIGSGTDAGQGWFLLMLLAMTAPPLVMLAARYLRDTGPASGATTGSRRTPGPAGR